MGLRDSQRQKVFDAEETLVRLLPSCKLDSFDSTCDYIMTTTNTRWWKTRCPRRASQIRVERARSDSCTSLSFFDGEIRLAQCHYDKITILHELCHLLIPWHCASHGREFCKTMLEMTGRFISPGAKGMLRAEYRKRGVKWCARKNISAAQRAAMAERARRNFGLV